jgi:ABC-type antimicrobial peptide transport system permease subunit
VKILGVIITLGFAYFIYLAGNSRVGRGVVQETEEIYHPRIVKGAKLYAYAIIAMLVIGAIVALFK